MRHGDGVAGEDVEAIDTAECGPERARVIKVEQHSVATFTPKPLQIRLLAHADTNACVSWISVEILQNEASGLASDAHQENKWLAIVCHHFAPDGCDYSEGKRRGAAQRMIR